MRRHIKSTRAKEHDRGFRIVKGSKSSKIDITVALAMACLGAVRSFNQEGDNGPEQIIHYDSPLGGVWVEEPPGKEKPFEFLHLVTPEEQKKKEENEDFEW